jgi:hypothetical protein
MVFPARSSPQVFEQGVSREFDFGSQRLEPSEVQQHFPHIKVCLVERLALNRISYLY